tara:strand:+ start:3996 stop:4427 length:432 start_codon:yes stop_codon:yes gene_type:complete
MSGINKIELDIIGKPKAQQRHRHTKRGFVYDPSKSDKEDILKQIYLKAPKKPFEGAISLYVMFSMPYVKKHYRTGKYSKELKPNPPMSYLIKPDIDNMLKLIMDAGNNVLWKDDSQICRVHMEKVYAVNGGTRITVVEDNWQE